MTERQAIKAMQEQLEAIYDALINYHDFSMYRHCPLCDFVKSKAPTKLRNCDLCPIVKCFGADSDHLSNYKCHDLNKLKHSRSPDSIDTLIGGCEFMLTKG